MSNGGTVKQIAIVGAGPTGLYTLFSLLEAGPPLTIAVYEQAAEAGVGMPYNDDENIRLMLANIASIEIPPLTETYLDWLRRQDSTRLIRYGVDKKSLHERQFLPRILLGEYFRDQFLILVERGKASSFEINVHESCCVTDLEAQEKGICLWSECEGEQPQQFDLVVIATGHVWPDEDEATRSFFPSPWSGLLDARIPAAKVGIMGTSLSAIDAAMAVASQHGHFIEEAKGVLHFVRDQGSEALTITLMSRSGILPEADFYCPIPYEPLQVATSAAIEDTISAGSEGLLDRVFKLMSQEIAIADPDWCARIALSGLTVDSFADAYFADRHRHDAFRWAAYNLREAERNKRERRTVPWRYAILRLHEAMQKIVPHLTETDRDRFNTGLGKVFTDNYAAIPSESIRRLLALRNAGVISLLELGADYDMKIGENRTSITIGNEVHSYDVFIDARGQKPLTSKDIEFPSLRDQLLRAGEDIPHVDDNYMLIRPDSLRGRVAFGALPYLLHDKPFVQGITASAEIGRAIANALNLAAHQAVDTHQQAR